MDLNAITLSKSMQSYFEKLIYDYENAEVTSLILHNREINQWFSLFTIIELIPAEQMPSTLIGTEATNYLDRSNIDERYTVYIARMIKCKPENAIKIFEKPEDGFVLQHEAILNCPVKLFNEAVLEAEPPSDYPLVVNNKTDHTVGNILPNRHTDFRVWAKIDRNKNWLSQFDTKQKGKLFVTIGKLSLKHFGFDISRLRQHLGNVYLCCCNPYLRKYECTLLDRNRELLISFSERQGKTIVGKKLILEDKRGGNMGFSIERIIKSRYEKIMLPHFPDQLCTKLYDCNGFLTDNHVGTWMNITFGMQIQTAELNLTVKEGKTKKKIIVPKYSSERPVKVGTYDNSLVYYLKGQQRSKEIEKLQASKEFIFFPGSTSDKEKARTIIGEILNRASKQCILLDPYFGARDLFYAYIIKNTSVPIQILTSAVFLKTKVTTSKGKILTKGILLQKEFIKYKKNFPHQKIECKVLIGGKSRLHDRYIVTDNTVYLMGSSFNEFGTRATTFYKVPAPEIMINQAIEWWEDSSKTLSLETFIKSVK